MCTFVIQSDWGGDQIPAQTGSSYTFSNARMIHGTVGVTLNGTLNFQQGTAMTDVITGNSFTVTIESSSLWFYGATVQTKSGTNVTGCTVTTSSNHNTLTVTIPQGKTFGAVILDYVSNPPMTNSNTTVTVPQGNYWVSNSNHKPKPEPTVVYGGQTTLVKDTDYTLSWSNNSSAGTGTVTVTGIGNYAGSATGFFYIRWAIYYVHFDKNHDDATGTISDQVFIYNTAQALTDNTFSRTGYSFDGWSTTSNGAVTYTDGQSVNNLTAEDGQTVTLYAQWAPITYNISYDLAGGSVATANPTTYHIETATFTLNNPTRTGYTFAGWTGSNGTTPQTTVTINQGSIGDRSFTANWAPITYNISYDLGGGSVATANPTSYNVTTSTFTLNNPTKTGYTFAGWTGTDLTEATQTVTIAQGSIGNLSYTANWTPITYDITYDLDGGSVATANPTSYNVTTNTFTLNNPTKTGYTFAGWTGTDLTEATQAVTIAQGSMGDRSYTANWAVIPWTGDGSSGSPYLIIYPSQLDLLAKMVNGTDGYTANTFQGKHFKLGNDITYSTTGLGENESNYTAIGNGSSKYFQGTFDGDGKTISGIRIYTTDNYQGLFGFVYSGTVKNVTLANSIITGGDRVGGIVGNILGAIVTNCIVESSVTINAGKSVAFHHGGIAGRNTGTVSGCISAATVSNNGYDSCKFYGGIVGKNTGTVQNCLYTGTSVTASSYYGSIVGQNDSGILTNNYYTAIELGGVGDNGNATVSADTDGARRARTITLGENVVLVGDETEAYNLSGLTAIGTGNYALSYNDGTTATIYSGATQNITLNYTGTIPEGYRLAYYTVNNEPVEGNTFEMPAADVVIEAVLLERYYTYNSTTGELALIFGAFNGSNKWGSDVTPSAVTSVTATDEVSFTGSCFELFRGFSNCTSMDLTNVNTDALTRTNYMFFSCGSLTTLDLSSWNTASVTDISNMFTCCSSLTTLNLSGWNTASVTNMVGMFSQDKSLTTIEGLSDFVTGNVTVMAGMFEYCSSLTTLNLSEWNTGNVTNMSSMFNRCTSLTTIEGLSDFDTGNVTRMERLFQLCSSLTTLDLSGWNTTSITNMLDMFDGCSGLTSLDLSGWNTGNVTDMSTMFSGCSNLTTIYVGAGWGTANVTNSDYMFSSSTNLVGGMGTTYSNSHINGTYARIDMGPNSDQPGYLTGVFTIDLPEDVTITSAATLTHGDVNLYAVGTTITLTYSGEVPEGYGPVYSVNGNSFSGNSFEMPFEDASVTVEVQRLRYTFINGELALLYGEFNSDNKWGSDVSASAVTSVTATDEVSFTGDCSSLFAYFTNCTSMDLSNVNTENVTNIADMFNHCTSLTTLDLTGWNTTNVTDMNNMFFYCSVLETLEGISGWDVSNVTNMNRMFAASEGLATLDLSSWNTSNVTDMAFMFYACTNLATLDIANWDTEGITDMSYMFTGCHNIETLDLSSWNTSNVTNMTFMFIDCPLLTTIYVGEGWSTENVTSSTWMFYDCTSLVGGMGTQYDEDYIEAEYARIDHGEDEPGYLTGVFALTLADDITASPVATVTHDSVNYYAAGTTIMLSYSGNVPEGYAPIYSMNGTPLSGNRFEMPLGDATVTVDVQPARYTYDSTTGELALIWGEFNKDFKWGDDVTPTAVTSVTATDEVSFTGDCYRLFYNFSNCTSMDLSNVNTEGCTSMNSMFMGCVSLESLDVSNWNTGNVTYMSQMFMGCVSLESLDVSNWNTGNVTYMSQMFSGCSNLQSIDLSGWNTSNVTYMAQMFNGCSNLQSIDLSGWNTSNVINMRAMFYDCYNLISIYAGSNWTTENVVNFSNMFYHCINLVGGMGTTYDADHTDAEYAHIDGGIWEPGYFTARFDPIEYIDADGNTQTCTDYIVLEGSDDFIRYGHDNVEAWYVVNHNVTYNASVMFRGGVNLILVDGATLNLVNESEDLHSMYCNESLTVYVQSGGTGAIVGNNVVISSPQAIIHGGHFTLSDSNYSNALQMSDLTINGGIISAETNWDAIIADLLTINGGTVTATVTEDGSAIYADDVVVINGGVVTTTNQQDGVGIYGSNNVTINGGIVTANASGYYDGIFTYGTIMLGWTNESDRITASSYYGEVTVATGQAFSDETGHCYLNTLTDNQIAAIAGQTLSPFTDFGATFSITYETDGGTLPEGYPETYTYAETISLPIPTKEDNTFWGWFDNAAFDGDPVTEITAGTNLGDKTFYAYWLPKYTDVTYLDADGQPQTVRATILYNNETYTGVYEGGVYTVSDSEGGYAFYNLLRFTGDATLILPDGGF